MSARSMAASDQPAERGRRLLSRNALYDQKDVADFLGTTLRTLAQWRTDGTGPQFRKIRKRVVYLGQDVNDWVLCQSHQSAARGPDKETSA